MSGRPLRLLVIVLSLLAASILSAAPAAASTRGPVCVPVYLTGTGKSTSPTTTTATLYLFGREIATTTGVFTATAPDFTGRVVITPKRLRGGTLEATVSGSYKFDSDNIPNGFDAEGPVVGTGVLTGATGRLRFEGPLTFSTGEFTEKVTGKLCADLSRW